MKLTKDEGRDVISGFHSDWETVESEIVDTSRWSIHHRGVFLHRPTGKHYELYWSVGATEQQYESPFEYNDPKPVEVKPIEKVTTVWIPVK